MIPVTAIEVNANGSRLREVAIVEYHSHWNHAKVAALRGKYKDHVRVVPLAQLKFWMVGEASS